MILFKKYFVTLKFNKMSTQTKTISDFLNRTQEVVEQILGSDNLKTIIEISQKAHEDPSLLTEDLNKIWRTQTERLLFIVLSREEIKQIIKDYNSLRHANYWYLGMNNDFTKTIIHRFKDLCFSKTQKDLIEIKKEFYSTNYSIKSSIFISILDSIIADKIKINKNEETLDSLMEYRLIMNNVMDSYAIKTIDTCIAEKVETSTDILKLKKFSQELHDIQAKLSSSLESGYYNNDKIIRIMRNRIDTLSSIIIKDMNYSSIEEVLENASNLTKNQLVSAESIAHEIKRILEENLKNESLQVVFKTFQSINKKPANVWQYTDESEDYLKELMASKQFDSTEGYSLEQMIVIFKFLSKNKIYNKDFESKFKKEYRKEENTNIHRYTTIYFLRKKYHCEDKELNDVYKTLISTETSFDVLNKIIQISGIFGYLDYSIQRLCEKRVLELIDQKSQQDFEEIFAKCIEKKYFYGNQNFFIEKAKSFGL